MNMTKTTEQLQMELIREREELLVKKFTCEHTSFKYWARDDQCGVTCEYCGGKFVLTLPKEKELNKRGRMPQRIEGDT